jgi:hypothetical protein
MKTKGRIVGITVAVVFIIALAVFFKFKTEPSAEPVVLVAEPVVEQQVPEVDLSAQIDVKFAELETMEEDASAINLLLGSKETDYQWSSLTPAARRIRKVTPDISLMQADPVFKKGDLLSLPLFDDAVFSAEITSVTRYLNGGVGMTAHLRGEDDGVAYLSYSGSELRASIEVIGSADYYIRYESDAESHFVIEIDPEKTIYEGCGQSMLSDDSPSAADRAG